MCLGASNNQYWSKYLQHVANTALHHDERMNDHILDLDDTKKAVSQVIHTSRYDFNSPLTILHHKISSFFWSLPPWYN